ncbi:AraC family transcriptional regulator [bacterium 210820-DFI.6.37]|nr:AraC family transcriptional regulator [bacterium 210820-DFI.6.37]
MQFNEIVGFKLNSGIKAVLQSIAYYPFHLHTHVLEVLCVLDGKFRISDCAHDHILSYGDVYFFNNRDPHKIEKLEPNGILLTVYIDLAHYKPFFEDFKDGDYDITTMPYFICDSFHYEDKYTLDIKYLRFLLAKIYTEYAGPRPSDFRLETMGKELLSHILQHYQNYSYSKIEDGKYIIIRHKDSENYPSRYERIYRIIDFIYDHFKEKITLEQVAKQEFLTASYLSVYIKKTSGLSFSEILSIARCEEAEKLLSATDKTVEQIASEAGFANRSNLTIQFRKWFRKTPAQYRKSIRADLQRTNTVRYDNFDYEFSKKIINLYLDEY